MRHVIIKTFNDLTNKELYDILKIRNEVFIVEQYCPYLDCDDKDFDAFHVMLVENNQIVSYARIFAPGVVYKDFCCIGRVLTKRLYRKRNFGQKIMNIAIDFCATQFQSPIKISAQYYLKSFYKKLGFVPDSSPYLEDNILHLSMIKIK